NSLRSTWLIPNIADVATVAHVRSCGADGNNVIGGGDADAGIHAQGQVAVPAGVVIQRPNTNGRVEVAFDTDAVTVAIERLEANGRVADAIYVAIERPITVGGVVVAGVIVRERTAACGCIEVAVEVV